MKQILTNIILIIVLVAGAFLVLAYDFIGHAFIGTLLGWVALVLLVDQNSDNVRYQ